MAKIIFNEEQFAKEALCATKSHVYNTQEAIIIAKYLNTQLPNELIRSTLIHVLSLTNPHFNPTVSYRIVETALNNAYLPLRTCNPIKISSQDMVLITSLSEDAAKVLFTMLVIARFNRENPIITSSSPPSYIDTRLRCNTPIYEILRLAKVHRLKAKTICEEIFPLLEQWADRDNKVHRILPFSPLLPDTYPEITIHDFSNLIDYYYKIFDPTIKECNICHGIFKSKTKQRIICGKCKEQKPLCVICRDCGRIFEAKRKDQLRCGGCYQKYRYKLKHKMLEGKN